MSLKIYHNPRCSKSRQTLELLREKGFSPEIVEYLKTTPTAAELDQILKALRLEPVKVVRKQESVYRELGLEGKSLSRQDWIRTIVQNPVLLERPIVVHGTLAALGRPPENVLEIL